MSSDCSKIKEVAIKIVKDYLSGHWKTADANNIIVTRLSGGLSNWLYQISLSTFQNQTETSDPTTVLLRFHGPNYDKSAFEQIVNDSLIFMLLSERELGPKLHGVFPGGRIEEYLSGRSLLTSELRDPNISTAIAVKVAKIHSLSVPISKKPDSLFEIMFKWLGELQSEWKNIKPKDLHEEKLMSLFQSHDLISEIAWLRQHLQSLKSPVVFCHNDLQEGNILITNDSVGSKKPSLVFIDFECCSYNYRAFEFANHFLEFTMNYKSEKFPFFTVDMHLYPSIEFQVQFIRTYLKVYNELVQNSSTNKILKENNLEFNGLNKLTHLELSKEEAALLTEISHFRMYSHLLWAIWSATLSRSEFKFGYWDYSILRLNAYFDTKKELLMS